MIEEGQPVRIENSSGTISFRNQADSADLTYALKNVFRGITPTASGWGTAPTTLGNITDGDPATVTGQGSTNQGGAGDYGIILFDLTTSKRVMVGGRLGIWSAAGAVYVFIESSNDNITWRGNTGLIGAQNASWFLQKTTEVISDGLAAILEGRYIRLRFYVSAAANTANAKIYEIWGYELGL